MATRKNTRKSIRTTSDETPFAASDKQFAADVWAKLLAGDPLVAGQPFEDNDACSMMARIVAMYKDYERSQQPKVDAEIQYLFDPPTSA
jgi:hypothetical protein